MRALVIREPGGPEVLTLRDVEDPSPGRGQVRVRVRATAVNRADLLQRRGQYPAPEGAPQDIPGLEFAGEVEALGKGVTRVKVGDRVMGITAGGGYAERLVIEEALLVPIPARLSFEEAAAIPEVFFTAFDAAVLQGGLAKGQSLLVTAVGSGVGTAAVQIARALGATSVGVARTADKVERAKRLGLSAGIVAKEPPYAEAVRTATGGKGADVALELVGGKWTPESLAALAPKGRLVLVGLMAGAKAELNLGQLLAKRLTVIGTALRTRSVQEKAALVGEFRHQLLPKFEAGELAPVIDTVMKAEDAAEAHRRLEANETFGKLVLAW